MIDGLVRVFIGHEDKELLLRYMEPAEMRDELLGAAGAHALSYQSRHRAPDHPAADARGTVGEWMREHPALSPLFFHQYNERESDMLRTVEQLALGDLAARVLAHLKQLHAVTGDELLDVRHARLAQELGSARELITRTLKMLERDGALRQEDGGIRLLR